MSPKFFLTALDVAAALVYWNHGDARKAVYWFAAAALTTVVIW